jgi:hypothetical protein
VHHADIDKEKWDRCINNAANGLIYGYSYYLDIMSANWDALIMGDYEVVMPLTWNKKLGISYLRQPAFTQQLGIFGSPLFDDNLIAAFIGRALEHFSLVEINLNFANHLNTTVNKCNLILPLNEPFIEIEKRFKKDLIKNVRKAKKNNLVYEATDEFEKAIMLYKDTYSERFYKPEEDYNNFLNLCIELKNKNQVTIRKVSSSEGQLLAIGIFMKDDKRIYKTMTTTLKDGRDQEANHFLLYELIKEYSGQDLIFDFTGSDIPSINSFCRKFGSIEQPYFFAGINHLPFFIKEAKQIYDYFKSGKKETGKVSCQR